MTRREREMTDLGTTAHDTHTRLPRSRANCYAAFQLLGVVHSQRLAFWACPGPFTVSEIYICGLTVKHRGPEVASCRMEPGNFNALGRASIWLTFKGCKGLRESLCFPLLALCRCSLPPPSQVIYGHIRPYLRQLPPVPAAREHGAGFRLHLPSPPPRERTWELTSLGTGEPLVHLLWT